MIETLRIEHLAIVDRVELEFGPGLNAITGETGAGKSIVLGALGLLAGARATSDSVREGSEEAAVEAIFRTEHLPQLEAALASRGLESRDHQLVLRRTVSRSGRGRARVGGQLVPVATLTELFTGRIEISSQHDSQALLRPDVHGRLLDESGGLGSPREAVSSAFAALRALDEELVSLREAARERTRRADFLSFQVNEIDEARLDPAEAAPLRARRGRLAHAGRLREEGGAALSMLAGDPLGNEDANAADLLGEAARRLEVLARIVPDLTPAATRLEALAVEARDAALELERYLDEVEADPAELAAADERLHQIEQLQRKYGASVEEVLRFRDTASAELAGLEGADERAERLAAERDRAVQSLATAARSLSRGRARAARKLARGVQDSLRQLAMPNARFEIGLEPLDPPQGFPSGAGGLERPEFHFTANEGEPLRALRRIASGGELSRAFLAIKQALRATDAGMVLVFDEVDAGIGGATADRVGRVLADLAASHQVLCITHLPQIAASADTHFRVEKSGRGGRAGVRISRVEGAERVEEIARMAGGRKVGEATRRHARELLGPRATP